MRPLPVIVAIALALLVAGCSDETTIINQTTTTVSQPAAGDTTVVVETGTPESPEPVPVPEESIEPEEPPKPSANPNDDDYRGPCGEQGVAVGGQPGSSATTAQPGYANLTAMGANCGDAVAAATGFLAAWDASCAAGCELRIEDMRCDYSGSGSHVECVRGDGRVRFDLAFKFG